MNNIRKTLLASCACFLLSPVSVMAQGTTNTQRAALPEIVVTSQRRKQKLQEVPISVNAFSAQDIADAGITNTQDFINLTPNVSLDDSFTYGNTFVVVRGLTQINNADSPIAIVVDGVPQNNQKQLKMNLFDIERIEVLKGPQGALYGRNAIGGAINIITKQPSNDFSGFAQASYGNGDTVEVLGGFSGPIVEDKLLFRVAGFYKESDGFINNTFLNRKADFVDHDYSIRGKLLFTPTENVTVDLRGSYSDYQAGSIYDSVVDSGLANDFVDPREDFLGVTDGDTTEVTGKIDIDLGFAKFTSITGYTDLYEQYRGDLDFSNPVNDPGGFLGLLGPVGQGQNLDVQMTSQEMRLTSPNDKRLRWIVGAYYIHTDRSLLTRAFLDMNQTPAQFDSGIIIVQLSEDNNNNAWAVFGQADFDITNKFTVSGALRFDEDRRNQTDLVGGGKRRKKFSSLQPKITLTYHATDDALVYATYDTGFRSGGFNAPGLGRFKDETLDNYEVGVKSSWFDNRLTFNAAGYFSKDNNFQFFFVDVLRAAQVIGNIDRVNIKGLDIDFRSLIAPGLQFFGGVGVTDSTIKKSSARPADVGNKTPKTTSWSMNLGVQYERPITSLFDGFFRFDYEHRGKKYWHTDNVHVQNPIDLLNLRTGIKTEVWSLTFWAKNLSDEKYFADLNSPVFSGLPSVIGFRAQPRTYGVEGKVHF